MESGTESAKESRTSASGTSSTTRSCLRPESRYEDAAGCNDFAIMSDQMYPDSSSRVGHPVAPPLGPTTSLSLLLGESTTSSSSNVIRTGLASEEDNASSGNDELSESDERSRSYSSLLPANDSTSASNEPKVDFALTNTPSRLESTVRFVHSTPVPWSSSGEFHLPAPTNTPVAASGISYSSVDAALAPPVTLAGNPSTSSSDTRKRRQKEAQTARTKLARSDSQARVRRRHSCSPQVLVRTPIWVANDPELGRLLSRSLVNSSALYAARRRALRRYCLHSASVRERRSYVAASGLAHSRRVHRKAARFDRCGAARDDESTCVQQELARV